MRSAKQPNLQENPVNSLKNLHIPTDAILQGDSLAVLKTLPDSSVRCCVTSPPYYALRDYGVEGQIGREASPEAYIQRLVEVFREVYRVLRKDGTFWLNIFRYLLQAHPSGRKGQGHAGHPVAAGAGAP